MRAKIVIDVPDEWIAKRVAEINGEHRHEGADHDAFNRVEDFLVARLTDVAEDELRMALWQWPIETSIEVEP